MKTVWSRLHTLLETIHHDPTLSKGHGSGFEIAFQKQLQHHGIFIYMMNELLSSPVEWSMNIKLRFRMEESDRERLYRRVVEDLRRL